MYFFQFQGELNKINELDQDLFDCSEPGDFSKVMMIMMIMMMM